MKWLLAFITFTGLLALPAAARADVPGLQASPLEYQDTLTPGHVKTGYIDVSNPGDSQITIDSSVKGYRQLDTAGTPGFFDDPQLSQGIIVGLTSFELGPREAVRVGFTVDPAKLPYGGVYAAIFFRTVPPQQAPESSYVSESANIGTILELTNGAVGPHEGQVSAATFGFWQFGNGLQGSLTYRNTDRSAHPQGFRPSLTVQAFPWGAAPKLTTGLVLPGASRVFTVARPGAFFGLLPLIITDSDTHRSTYRWVFACTGWYQWLMLVVALAAIIGLIIWIKNVFKRPFRPIRRRPLDGLSRKP